MSRAVSDRIAEPANRAVLADAAQSPDRDFAAVPDRQPVVRVPDPVRQIQDAADPPADPERARASAEILRSTETTIRER